MQHKLVPVWSHDYSGKEWALDVKYLIPYSVFCMQHRLAVYFLVLINFGINGLSSKYFIPYSIFYMQHKHVPVWPHDNSGKEWVLDVKYVIPYSVFCMQHRLALF